MGRIFAALEATNLRGGKACPLHRPAQGLCELQLLVEAGYLEPLNDIAPALDEMPEAATGGVVA